MRANPGGEISANDVVGRDKLIESLWRTLEGQSIVLVSERRMGKSSVMKKMREERPDNLLAFYSDVEGIDSPIGFVEHVYHAVSDCLSRRQRVADGAKLMLCQLAGSEIAGLVKFPEAAAPHWQKLLEKTMEDLSKHQDQTVVFFWDELPLMLQKIKRTAGEESAMHLLDVLRSLRQTHRKLRMVFAGSIGLHHILSVLKEAGHTNDATNDMRTIEVPPLSVADAKSLASKLLVGEGIRSGDPNATIAAIAEGSDCIPFYIHHIVAMMKDKGVNGSVSAVNQLVADSIVDPQDIWHLRHYRDRLADYYGADREPVVLYLLDELATAREAFSFTPLLSRLQLHVKPERCVTAAQIIGGDTELLRRILELMQRDHYVIQRPSDGAYEFRFPLIKRWWQLHRNLQC